MQSNVPEIWGGIECSYTRIKNKYGDQLDYCGHYRRGIEDLHYIAQLGIKTIRYPIIWERYGNLSDDDLSWAWLERQLNTLRYLKITPIAGLLHHGSGPIHATLSDHSFPYEIEKFAKLVAEKFPWLQYYTPINEPLTTARFCGLYGFWYPHHRDARSFAEMLLNEMKAVVLSMRAIRKVNPEAKLIQTEDMGKTYSTKLLRYQADFENQRRWLTCDLLCGSVKPGHPMWDYLLWLKIPQHALEFFLENVCTPDMIGLDYYLTSERFLDERLDLYPTSTHGSNDRDQYADIEAIRIKHKEPFGPKILLKECWERYHIPIAVTEIHIHGSPDEQIAWFNYVRKACLELLQQGVDIRATTAWALFGSFGWSSILTNCPGEYERGVYDVSSGDLIQTAYTDFIKALIRDPKVSNSFASSGWWESKDRFIRKNILQDT